MSVSKARGTKDERQVKSEHQAKYFDVIRLAEEGSLDLGDLSVTTNLGPVYIECKFREGLTVHGEIAKAIRKSDTHRTVLFWKRLVKAGKTARQPIEGQREVVVMDKKFYYELLEAITQ